MVLSTDSIFGKRDPSVDDGYLATSTSGNMSEAAVISDDGTDTGILSNMWDTDTSTYYGVTSSINGSKYLKFDLLSRKQNIVLQVYYAAFTNTRPNVVTVTVATSVDDSTYTDIDSVSTVSGTPNIAFKNLSVNINARYVRFTISGNAGGGELADARIYNIKIAKAIEE